MARVSTNRSSFNFTLDYETNRQRINLKADVREAIEMQRVSPRLKLSGKTREEGKNVENVQKRQEYRTRGREREVRSNEKNDDSRETRQWEGDKEVYRKKRR